MPARRDGEQRRGAAGSIDHLAGEWRDGIRNNDGDGECHEQMEWRVCNSSWTGQMWGAQLRGTLQLLLGYDEEFKWDTHAEGGSEGHGRERAQQV